MAKSIVNDIAAQSDVAKLLSLGYTMDDIQAVMNDITQSPIAISLIRDLLQRGYQFTDIQNGIVLQAQVVANQLISASNQASLSNPTNTTGT